MDDKIFNRKINRLLPMGYYAVTEDEINNWENIKVAAMDADIKYLIELLQGEEIGFTDDAPTILKLRALQAELEADHE